MPISIFNIYIITDTMFIDSHKLHTKIYVCACVVCMYIYINVYVYEYSYTHMHTSVVFVFLPQPHPSLYSSKSLSHYFTCLWICEIMSSLLSFPSCFPSFLYFLLHSTIFTWRQSHSFYFSFMLVLYDILYIKWM